MEYQNPQWLEAQVISSDSCQGLYQYMEFEINPSKWAATLYVLKLKPKDILKNHLYENRDILKMKQR